MIEVILETADERFVANVLVAPFMTPPDIIIWGERYFKFHSQEPQPVYRECFVTVSFTTPEEAMALSSK